MATETVNRPVSFLCSLFLIVLCFFFVLHSRFFFFLVLYVTMTNKLLQANNQKKTHLNDFGGVLGGGKGLNEGEQPDKFHGE